MIEVGDLILVTLRGILHGQRTLNTFWYYAKVEDPGMEEADMAAAFATAWNAQNQAGIAGCASNEQQYTAVRAQLLRPNGTTNPQRWTFIDDVPNEPMGTVVQSALPSVMSAVFRRRTAIAGRKYRGRVYISGVPYTFEDDSTLTTAGYNAITTGWSSAMVQAVTVGGNEYPPCITNSPLHSRITEVTSASLDSVLRAQRRREVGVGE